MTVNRARLDDLANTRSNMKIQFNKLDGKERNFVKLRLSIISVFKVQELTHVLEMAVLEQITKQPNTWRENIRMTDSFYCWGTNC